MNARALENRITRRLVRRRNVSRAAGAPGLAERVIAVLAATAAVFVLGSYLQELLWVLVAAATALALGVRDR